MIRALFKKQFLEMNTFYFVDRRTGERRSKRGIILYVLLFAFVFLSVAVMFFGISKMLFDVLHQMDRDWLFWALVGLMAIGLGTFGSVFNTYNGLYQAKDNEMLLSMPIPPSVILLVRMFTVFAMSLLYSALVWIPAIVCYCVSASMSVPALVFTLLLTFVIAAFVTVLTCVLGWLVALAVGRMKNKSAITVIATVLFLAVYYFVYFRLNKMLQQLMLNYDKVGKAITTWLYPMKMLGQAACGNAVSMLIFTAITAVLLALCVFVLSRSFIKIATTNRGVDKKEYKPAEVRTTSVQSALLKKEFRRFLTCPSYMLNASLGIIILPALVVVAFIKRDLLTGLLFTLELLSPRIAAAVPVFLPAAVCVILAINAISAPSVSLEGKSIWILQSVPVDGWLVLKAKLAMHVLLNGIIGVVCVVLLALMLEANILLILLMALYVVLFVILTGEIGLILNLKKPILSWTNEAVPVKQSISVLIALFGGWVIALAGGAAILIFKHPLPELYLAVLSVVFAAVCFALLKWMKGKGAAIFEKLS